MANKHELGNNLKNDNELFSQLLSGETVRSFTVNKINLICRLRDEQPKKLTTKYNKELLFCNYILSPVLVVIHIYMKLVHSFL